MSSSLRRVLRASAVLAPALLVDLSAFGGAAVIAYGAWRIYEPAGFVVAGVFLLAAAWLGQRRLV